MLVTGGRLGDILGRRRLFMIGVVGFTATSVLGGAAQSPGMLIGSRIAQGLTGALMFPQGLSMIQAIFPERERARAFGVFGAAAGLAIVLGPLLGGLIVGDQVGGESWRFVFLVNAPIGVVALLAAAGFVPETRAPGAHGVDLGGVALVSVGLFGVTFPLLEGRDADWAPWIWLCIAGGVAVLLGFVTYERRRGGQGLPTLVQLGMFRERAFSIGSVLAFALFVGIPSWLFTFNLMLQAGLGYTALHAGLTTLAFSGGVFVGAIMGVRLESRLGDRGVLALGTLFATAGSLGTIGILAARDASVTSTDLAPALLAMGLGFGNAAPRLLAVILSRVGSADAGAGSGVLTTVQQVGGALGVAVVGVALFSLLGSTAEATVHEYTPQIRTAVVQEFHLPLARLNSFTDGVEQCFVERVHAKDPAAGIAGCPSPTPALRATPLGRVDSTALAATFVRAERTALFINAGVLALAFLLVIALPRSPRPGTAARAHH
jgi:predicted MFS family arabinose efflux permease